MKKTIALIIIIVSYLSLKAQITQPIWNQIDEKNVYITGKRDIIPNQYGVFHLNVISLKNTLLSAPSDKTTNINWSWFKNECKKYHLIFMIRCDSDNIYN